MKLLSVLQPWATLIVSGAKRIETRSWKTAYRGPIAIQAGKRFLPAQLALCQQEPFATALDGHHELDEATQKMVLPRVAIVGTVDLIGCVSMDGLTAAVAQAVRHGLTSVLPDGMTEPFGLSRDEIAFGDYRPGRWAWVLTNPVQFLKPVPFKGALGLVEIPDPEYMELLAHA